MCLVILASYSEESYRNGVHIRLATDYHLRDFYLVDRSQPPPPPPHLTSHLLTISPDAYIRATQHTFLKAAGNQTISKERLENWLTQDRIYAFVGYPKFISLLSSRVPLRSSSTSYKLTVSESHGNDDNAATLEERILSLLSSCLSNIVLEIDFFKKTARENGLDIMKLPKIGLSVEDEVIGSITKAYTDFMISTAATESLSDGLVLLWATEKCYLDAWTYARSHMTAPTVSATSGPSRALEAFINNWTTDEFRALVDRIGSLLDEYAATFSPSEYEDLKHRAESIWKWCLWYEERFWDGE